MHRTHVTGFGCAGVGETNRRWCQRCWLPNGMMYRQIKAPVTRYFLLWYWCMQHSYCVKIYERLDKQVHGLWRVQLVSFKKMLMTSKNRRNLPIPKVISQKSFVQSFLNLYCITALHDIDCFRGRSFVYSVVLWPRGCSFCNQQSNIITKTRNYTKTCRQGGLY